MRTCTAWNFSKAGGSLHSLNDTVSPSCGTYSPSMLQMCTHNSRAQCLFHGLGVSSAHMPYSRPHTTHSSTCTNMSSPPSLGVMKPWPFCRQNHFTMPSLSGPCRARSDLQLFSDCIMNARARLTRTRDACAPWAPATAAPCHARADAASCAQHCEHQSRCPFEHA